MFFPCEIIFLDHKYTIWSYVCLNYKKRVCSNLVLKVCVFSMQTFCFVLVQVLSKLRCCGEKHVELEHYAWREEDSFC